MKKYGAVVYDKITVETEKARLFEIGDNNQWVPKSISRLDEIEGIKVVWIQMWFIDNNDLTDYIIDEESF